MRPSHPAGLLALWGQALALQAQNSIVMPGPGTAIYFFAASKAGNQTSNTSVKLRKDGVDVQTITISAGTNYAEAVIANGYSQGTKYSVVSTTTIGPAGLVDIGLVTVPSANPS